jgi:hypothetical protein
VTLFTFLLREQRWEIVSNLLSEPIPVRYLRREDGPGNAEWSDISRHVAILGGESQKRQRLSYHGDLLNERHSNDELAVAVPFDEFSEADFFLYLRGITPGNQSTGGFHWRPWSAVWLRGTPRFLLRAQSAAQAEAVREALALRSVSDLKSLLVEKAPELAVLYQGGFWDYPVRRGDIEKIGTR